MRGWVGVWWGADLPVRRIRSDRFANPHPDHRMKLQYQMGDATQPAAMPGETAIIVHVCNDGGGWGRGFVVALSARWPAPEQAYRSWHRDGAWEGVPFELGRAQMVEVEPDMFVANMIGQHGTRPKQGVPPVRYEAIRSALAEVRAFAVQRGAGVHMPRIGCGLAGGDWATVSAIVEDELVNHGVRVVVYDLPPRG